MMNRVLVMVLLILSMTVEAYADVQYVAVLEFRGVELDEQILHNLSDQSRRGATELLSKDEYLIMTRENMMGILQDMGKDATCVGGMCEIEIGRNLGADIVVTGDIVQYGETYVLTLKLYTTESGALIETVEVQEKDLLELKNDAFSQSKVLFQKGLGLSTASAASIQRGFTGEKPGTDDWMVTDSNTAVVQFESSPVGAVVLVDGQLLCTETPCSKELTSGGHTVVFQKERYFPYEVMINAKSGMTFSGDLKPRFGHVSVSSNPSGVKVLIDGENFGSTPIDGMEVDAGIHTLSIEDPCYVGQEYRFQMKTGDTENVTYPVTERQSAIKVTVTDKENVLLGDVYVDGAKVGQSSSVIKVPLCSKEVQVKMHDRIFTETLNLQERQVSELSVDTSRPQERKSDQVMKSVDYTVKRIPSGTFIMGCTSEQVGCEEEVPAHKVTLTQHFYMMQSEVTQELYERVMNSNPSKYNGKDRPVETVKWYDAVKFANRLSSMEGLEQCYFLDFDKILWLNMSCTGWRLPTEAEWEYAARGGQAYQYSGSNSVDDVAWYDKSSDGQTHDVCRKQVNGYGLCDMSGNVFEWVWDQYEESDDSISMVDPTGPIDGSFRVARGGGWDASNQSVQVSGRFNVDPANAYDGLGFRLVRTAGNNSYAPLRSED